MPGRTAKFVSVVVASVLAGIPLATISHGATPAADDCLSGPKDPAPNGSHWHYRIDHATKRHCWYLKGEKLSQNAAPNSSTAETTTQRSIADAHAELPAQAAIEAPKRGDGLAPAADATIATPAAETQRSAVASRWPEQSGTSSSTASLSTAANSGVAAPPDSDAAPPAAPAAVALAATSPEKQPGSLQTLLLAILGALALAGLIGSAVFRFGNLRWIGRRTIQVDRQAIWETANIDRRSPTPWELRTADDPNGRIEDMLARLARSATNYSVFERSGNRFA
jgi:hypothetical protein